MNTVVESPARRLRRELGLDAVTTTRKSGAFDCGFRIGDRVCRRDDPRHEGEVLSIFSHQVRLRWDGDPVMIGNEYAGDLQKV